MPVTAPDPRLAYVDCMVEATSCEQLDLWARLSTDSPNRPLRFNPGIPWEEDTAGRMTQVGEIADLPIWVTYFFALVDGAVLCFYEATSRAVDHVVVRKWADGVCSTHVNAMNFGNRPTSAEPTPNVAKYQAAREALRRNM